MSAKPSRSNSASAARSEASKGASMVKPASASLTPTDILSVIESLKKKVEANRLTDVKSRIEENKQKLMNVTVSKESNNTLLNKTGRNSDLLMKRQSDAVEMQKGIDINNMDKDSSDSQDDGVAPSAVLLGASIPVKSGVRPIRLPEVKTLPSYTTWIFLNRNQRMTEDQSVVGRRRIYYDPNGGEALICSDSEEEVIEEEEEKKEFAESEDYILRLV